MVFGDDGFVDWTIADGNPADIDLAASTTPTDGGNDVITAGSGSNLIVGGQGADTITAGAGFNVIAGDSAQLTAAVSDAARFGSLGLSLGRFETTADGVGGTDTIVAGDGSNIVLGGTGADQITTGNGTNMVFGDDGFVDWTIADGNPADIDLAASTTPTDGGTDKIKVGD